MIQITSYEQLLWWLHAEGDIIVNARTASKCLTLPCMKLDIPPDGVWFRLPGGRVVYPHIAAAELAWSLSGTQDPLFITSRTKIWDKFIETDGMIPSAYGYRWRRAFGRDQLMGCIEELTNDISSRQAVMVAWDPSQDGLTNSQQHHVALKNVPCPMAVVFTFSHNALHTHVTVRSSDAIVGLPYDYMFYQMLTEAVALELGVNSGITSLSLVNCHVYEQHMDVLKKLVSGDNFIKPCTMLKPKWSVTAILERPNQFIDEVRESAKGTQDGLLKCRLEAVQ